MINSTGFVDWCEQVPGHKHKVNGGANGLFGIAAHSAEGWERYLRDYQSSLKPEYYNRKASWNVSNLRDGKLLQHYSVLAQCWASGSGFPNNNFVAMEAEGIAGLPLNDAQIENVIHFAQDLSVFNRRTSFQRINAGIIDANEFLFVEHNECVRFGSLPTACPSNRYPWNEILTELNKPVENEVTFEVLIGWVDWAERPDDITYRSYLLFVDKDNGIKYRWVPHMFEHETLAACGIQLRHWNKAQMQAAGIEGFDE